MTIKRSVPALAPSMQSYYDGLWYEYDETYEGGKVVKLESAANGILKFTTPYNVSALAYLKANIPPAARRWGGEQDRSWYVAVRYGKVCVTIADKFYGMNISAPQQAMSSATTTHEIKLMYLGAARERENGETTAYGWVDGGWNVVFPVSVLKEWFGGVPKPTAAVQHQTKYETLGVSSSASRDEIRLAHRRAARTWHPDICTEPDAAERFRAIQEAYTLLSDPSKRQKYDVALLWEETARDREKEDRFTVASSTFSSQRASFSQFVQLYAASQSWRPPLRCGLLEVEGDQLIRLSVIKILAWDDVVNGKGETLVTSWRGSTFEEVWV